MRKGVGGALLTIAALGLSLLTGPASAVVPADAAAAADLVKMIAIDFTYSQKQIAARPTPVAALPGKKACDATNTVCVTLDRSRKSAKVSLAKVTGASEVLAVALRGTREDGPEVKASVKKGKASLTVKLAGAKSKGQIWVVRTPSTFISSFQVG